ncbi:hypothetical protein [Parachitinimonas caeni]|uniref:Uncharacterized protein n=1 Tax=Parachitinimonas caeni TaxID=3031301 RepID=A0ABT7DV22_9NEIS|nr:hypothetical protein [Parachitinimonas caeni]MDK2123907.1 hypothetical protein [Parachitinimonas caeni]
MVFVKLLILFVKWKNSKPHETIKHHKDGVVAGIVDDPIFNTQTFIMRANNPVVSSPIRNGFLLAGAYNILGVLTFSLVFTNSHLSAQSPAIFSTFGLICILLWGAAYLSVSRCYQMVPALLGVFVIEKLLYFLSWIVWLKDHAADLPRLYSESVLTGMFYTVYGAGDLLFGLFFGWVAWQSFRRG